MEISDLQLKLNQSLHQRKSNYGSRATASGLANRLPLALYRMHQIGLCSSVLDYGTGKGLLVKRLRHELPPEINVSGYDPAVKHWSQKPNQMFDIVTCFDVLEHVELNLIDNVLNDIASYTRRFCYVGIDLQPAVKLLDDGRNAHILLAPPEWWVTRFSQVFECITSFPVKHKSGVLQKIVIAASADARLMPQMYTFLNKINCYDLELKGGNLK